jgi:RimJ/RimL family protein N-acetyltransferase
VKLRPASDEDARLLFEWVNRAESLELKLETGAAIPWETHAAWFAARLADPGTGLWIAEHDGAPQGQVRAQLRERGLEIDIYVTPEARRQGRGREMLAFAAEACAARWPGTPLVARIKTENLASQRLFAAAGYALAERQDDHLVYLKEPASNNS